MSSPSERLSEAFGMASLPDALFYKFKYGLRFELGGEFGRDVPIPRLLQGLDRARAVSRALFETSSDVSAVFSFRRKSTDRPLRFESDLYWRALGLDHALGQPSVVFADRDLPPEYKHFVYCVDLKPWLPQADVVLWSALTSEMWFHPRGPFFTINTGGEYYLSDLGRGVILHIYDDRGMDVVATSPEPLVPLYDRFRDWLLTCDRSRMDEVFAPLSRHAPAGTGDGYR